MKAGKQILCALLLSVTLCMCLGAAAFAADSSDPAAVRFRVEKGYDPIGLHVFDAHGAELESASTEDGWTYLLPAGEYRWYYHDTRGIFRDIAESAFSVGTDALEIPLPLRPFVEDNAGTTIYINPIYREVVSEADLKAPAETTEEALDRIVEGLIAQSEQGFFFSDSATFEASAAGMSSAAEEVRAEMSDKQESIKVTLSSTDRWTQADMQAAMEDIVEQAIVHTGRHWEGDALRYDYVGYYCNWYYNDYSNGVYTHEFTYTMSYYSTTAQEHSVRRAVNSLVDSLGLSGKTDYDKISTINRYLYQNVVYDDAHFNNDRSYPTMYTAYAALIDQCAVCQGYSVAFYRLCLAAGVDARIISSNPMDHAWNIVCLEGAYYQMDATWDALRYHNGQSAPYYILRGTNWWLQNHISSNGVSDLGTITATDSFAYDPEIVNYNISYADHSRSFRVTYDANGGVDAPSGQTKTAGVTLTLSALTPTRESVVAGKYKLIVSPGRGYFDGGFMPKIYDVNNTTRYTFAGWNTKRDGSGTSYAPGSRYSAEESVTLYAQWSSGTAAETIMLPTPEREGFRFIGWSSEQDGLTVAASPGAYIPSGDIDERINLYAMYEASGTWGSLSWKLDNSLRLTVTGSGPMNDFASGDEKKAWRTDEAEITSVSVGSGVTSIGNYAFYKTGVEEITIPESVTRIGDYAFRNCCITEIDLPSGVTSIGDYAFYGSNITEVDLPAGLTDIGDYAFAYSDIESITILGGVTTIGEGVFYTCSDLQSAAIPADVTAIEDKAFYYCSALQSIALPESLQSIGEFAFSGCTGLTDIALPESLQSIGEFAFFGCTGLTDIALPNSLTKIEGNVFRNCTGLTYIALPDSLTSIGNGAFIGCGALRDVFYDGTEEQWSRVSIGYSGNEALQSAQLHCVLPDLVLPAALTQIGEEAFAGGAFIYVRLPETTAEIGSRAFADCPALRYICIPAADTVIDDDAFGGAEVTIIAPYSSTAMQFAYDHGCTFVPAA